VTAQPELHLVDGGEALQNNPIWPFLHRPNVDVLLVNDNSADTSANYPNGSEILTTYTEAIAAGLTRMPVIPSVETFISRGLNVRPTFFGCNDKNKMTIIYLPNTNYTYNSGQSTAKLQYSEAETRAMVANGIEIGSYGGNSSWAGCLGCGIMAKSGVTLPKGCVKCLAEFCYN
jgi:lysophospholipase